MTVKDMLRMPEFSEFTLIAGAAGLENDITNASVMDAPDIYNWMRGNEFLITTAYVYKDDIAGLTTLVHKLSQAGISAIGIKFNRYIGYLPEPVLNAANLEKLPLIHIPDRFPWTEIILPVMQHVVERNIQYLQRRDEIHNLFVNLAISNEPISEALLYLQAFLQRPVAFWDSSFHELHFSSPEDEFSVRLKGLLKHKPPMQLTESGITSYTVSNKHMTYGRIFYDNRSSDVLEQVMDTALEYASFVLIIRMQSKLLSISVEEKYRSQFLTDLLLDNIKSEEELLTRAGLYHLDFSGGGLVAVLDINNYRLSSQSEPEAHKVQLHNQHVDKAFHTATNLIVEQFQGAVCHKNSEYITFIIPATKQEQAKLRQRLEAVFARIRISLQDNIPFTCTIGVGTYYERFGEICKSFQEARDAINLGYQSSSSDCALFYEDLGIFRLLQSIKTSSESREYVHIYIMPLIRYENRYNIALMETLQAIIESGWKLKLASNTLHVHYNSVKYRFSKMGELLDLDLHHHQHQLNLEIAWHIFQMDQKTYYALLEPPT